jgi:F-type H+/Na+-transporting ATPase subunit beta
MRVEAEQEPRRTGRTVAVRGNVIDVRFASGLPAVSRRLETGHDGSTVLEVVSHVDARTVRTIALTPTRGLARGEAVTDTRVP